MFRKPNSNEPTPQINPSKLDPILSPEHLKSRRSSSGSTPLRSPDMSYSTSSHSFLDKIPQLSLSSSSRSDSTTSLTNSCSSSSLAEKMLKWDLAENLYRYPHELNFETVLGEGTCSTVYLGVLDEQKVAIKKLKPGTNREFDTDLLIKEAAYTAKLQSRHTLRLIAITENPDCLVIEHMEGGSLEYFLKANVAPTGLTLTLITIALDMIKGLHYLHRNGMIHCDLKSSNVLLDGKLRAKLADFGFMQRKKSATSPITSDEEGACGTTAWMAPELLRNTDLTPDFRTDIFSLGWLLWSLITHKTPFQDLTSKGLELISEMITRIIAGERGKIPQATPLAYAKLILDCWKEPHHRLNLDTALIELKKLKQAKKW